MSSNKMGDNIVPKSKDHRRTISDDVIDKQITQGVSLTASDSPPADSKAKPEPSSQKIFSLTPTQDAAIENVRRKSSSSKIPSRSDVVRAGLVLLLDCPPRRRDEIIAQIQQAATDEALRNELFQRDA